MEQDLLKQAALEIKQLRKQNEAMAIRLDMFDKCMLLFTSNPAYTYQGMSPDLVQQIEKHLENTKTE